MKMQIWAFALLLLCFSASAYSQTYTYYFNGNFNEANNSGPALTELLSCSAAPGSFATQTINTASGNCGTTTQPVFAFNAGGGVAFPNNNTIGSTYTIYIFWKFNSLNGYQRIIDFLDGSTDVGLYTLGNCLNFFPNGNVGTCSFTANTFYLLTLVRDGATNTITIYVNGTPFSTYIDASNTYVPTTSTSPIVFFRDNIASSAQCESRDGSVKYISISPTAATSEQVSATFNSICSIALPVNLSSFTASRSGANSLLNWQVSSASNTSAFIVQRSNSGTNFSDIGTIAFAAANNYSFTDRQANAGINYYRLKTVDRDGSFHYSSILKLDFKAKANLSLYPNPASNEIVVSGLAPNRALRLLNLNGVLLKKLTTTGETMTLAIDSYPKGVYVLEYEDGTATTRQKFVRY